MDRSREGSMVGRVDTAGEYFTEDGKDHPCTLYADPEQAASERLVDISGYAGHPVRVSYSSRTDDAAYGCDVGTRD